MHYAVRSNPDTAVLRLLVERAGAAQCVIPDVTGVSALHLAAGFRDCKVMRTLLEYVEAAELMTPDAKGWLPL